MARTGKKENALTAEERLKRALVPEEEWPYGVPGNWCWTKLAYLIEASKEKTEDFSNPSTKYVGLENMEKDSGIVSYGSSERVKSLKNIFSEGQILYGKLRPYLNKHGVATFDGICSTDILVFDVKKTTINKFVNYFFDLQFFIEYAVSNSKGINLPRVSENVVLESMCPLPPFAEQQRIVDHIERLFAKLDEAREKAQTVVDRFEERKAAVLHRAFTGELTEQWRNDSGIGSDSWQIKSVKDICHSLKYGTSKKSEKTGTVVVIRMGNLQQGEIDWTDLAFSTDEDDIEKYHLEPEDVLFNRTNSASLVGKTSIYRGEYPAIYAGYLIKLDYDHDVILGDYLNYALNTQDAKEYCNRVKTDGVNQSNINAQKIGAYVLPVPSLKEQFRIVEILKGSIEKEKEAREAAEQVISQIDTMKKSILARAFRGELGTNDPADESAEELLKRVLQEE